MKYKRLGKSDLVVSDVCLGTMTWGVQNSEEEAHAQLDYAISRGVNFLDTAELYPIPVFAPEWVPGRTEEIIGSYLCKHPGLRAKLIIATKILGYSPTSPVATVAEKRYNTPDAPPYKGLHHHRESVLSACAASLRRLQTDYIDLYQLHTPERYVPLFGQRTYKRELEREVNVSIRETLLALRDLLQVGKIRAYGLANETTFGVCEFVRVADELGMARPASIQNSFCLLDRRFEADLAEACAPSNFDIALLPWSILGGGVLSGKYQGKLDEQARTTDKVLGQSRLVKYPGLMDRFLAKSVLEAVDRYNEVANEAGISLAVMAQAFCKTRWYVGSSIIGTTSLEQLKENIEAFEVELSEDVLKKIDEVHNLNKDVVIAA